MKFQKGYQEYIKELGQKIKTYRIMNEMSQQDLSESGIRNILKKIQDELREYIIENLKDIE